MPLLKSSDLIELIKKQDPTGLSIVIFKIVDEYDHDKDIACGEVNTGDIDSVMKGGYQTSEGDKEVLRITIPLDAAI